MEPADQTLRILVIEDRETGRSAVRDVIERDGSEVVAASTLAAGMESIQRQRPDCVLVEQTLPDGPASSLLGWLEGLPSAPPVIILTGSDDETTALESLKSGAQDYLLESQLGDDRTVWRAIRHAVERQEVQRLRDRLIHTERLSAIGQLAAGVAHEINNPACYILANLGFIRESFGEIRDWLAGAGSGVEAERATELLAVVAEADDALADSIQGTERICQIVRELRPFASIERSELTPLDLNQVAQSAINLTRNEIRHRARLEVDLGDLPGIVGDRAKLCQVAVNLLANATQAIESGDADNNTIRVSTRLEGETVVFEVSDTGSGIDESVRQRIFEPFFTTRPRDVGTGLGLTICAATVRKHGGAIDVDSSPGQGSTFTVRLPRDNHIGVEARPLAPVGNAKVGATNKARVLLIDDDELIRVGLKRMLASTHDVTEADSGSALELIARNDYDVIICDLMMPDVDGAAVYEALSDQRPQLVDKVVFLTGGVFTPRVEEFVSNIGALILRKPVSRSRLLETIASLVG